jgi:bifunctional DNA-binding transcriptional regulator/antitoxin component of YhaV-PrlF toxin-antitoxin module
MEHLTFETTVTATGNNTGIVVPDEVVERLGAGRRPPVLVNVNGYDYRSTVGIVDGKHMVSISAAIRKETGLKGGDPVTVTLRVATSPREIEVPADLAAALASDGAANEFFATLSNSLQRFHVDNINGAKTEETRQRRIAKAISLFRAGKPR